MPYHVRAGPGDVAPDVLYPGDPRRAAYIAATYFDPGYRQINEERGMLGFTGTFEGRPITVQSTGMGCPSAGIVFEERSSSVPGGWSGSGRAAGSAGPAWSWPTRCRALGHVRGHHTAALRRLPGMGGG